jgi:1-acyl-sn-glycerol-3-phosphate acyltransferase
MEKFSQFQALSVNPFVTSLDSTPLATIALKAVIALVKAPVALVAVALLLSASGISALLPPGLRLWWRATAVRLASRFTLFVLGVWRIRVNTLDRRSVRSRPSPSQPSEVVKPGDVIVASHCSWVDALVLSALYAPQLTRTSLTGGLRPCTLVEAMKSSLQPLPEKLGPSAAESVQLFVTGSALGGVGPLLVFPEGATTNNRAILTFGPVASQLHEAVLRHTGKGKPTVHTIALQYDSTVPFVAGNPWLHAVLLLGSLSTPVTVHRLPPGHDPQPGDFVPTSISSDSRGAAGRGPGAPVSSVDAAQFPAWGLAVQQLLAQMLVGARAVASGGVEHAKFVELYRQKLQSKAGGSNTKAH